MLNPGSNCWRTEQADRLAFLIDAENYFRTLRRSMLLARHSIHILSWDINSQLQLRGDDDGYPERLGDFLNALAEERHGLNIYILNWDFAMIYVPDREFLPIYKMDWKTHRRVHFCLDDQHAEGASQHQKVVVIDDQLAFTGGLDLTLGRWDSSEHRADNDLRDRIGGEICNPYHDIQLMVNGPAAGALAELVRDRWHNATGKQLADTPQNPAQTPPWPEGVAADIEQARVGIARTRGEYKKLSDIREIQQLYSDTIDAAETSIYIENQYLTAPCIAEVLEKALQKEDGPEIVIVLPRETDGWLSQHTMDVLRVRLIRRLNKADRHQRLKILFPDGPDLQELPINVHAKVMVVDDRLAMVGSANLNNRSMGLDSECNILVEQTSETSRQSIASFRNRLMAEHMGCAEDSVREAFDEGKSLHQVVETLNHDAHRYFSDLPLDLPPEIDHLVPDTEVVDPEHPIRPDLMLPQLLPEEEQKPASKRIIQWLLLIGGIAALAAMWRWSPMHDWLNPEAIGAGIDSLRKLPAAPLLVIAGFVVAGVVAFPFALLIVGTVAAFGPFTGLIYSLIGGMLSALLLYGAGELLGRNVVRQLAGNRLNSISRTLARHGLITMIIVRIVPVAPFTVINLVAGASHINFRDYTVGTLLGMTPGMVAVILVADRLFATIQQPDIMNIAVLAITVLGVAAGGYVLVHWLRNRSKQDDPGDANERSTL